MPPHSGCQFQFEVRKDRSVVIVCRGRVAATLRGISAERFLAEAESADNEDLQHLMAAETGQFKFGNEGFAKKRREFKRAR